MTTKGKQIRLTPSTLQKLEGLRHPGQSFDGVIQELLDLVDKYAPLPKAPQETKQEVKHDDPIIPS